MNWAAATPLALSLFLLCGCDLTRLTANTTAGLFHEAAPAFDHHWDYEMAGEAAPGSILQLEGVYRIVPDNEDLLLELTKAYTGYAYGWIEDRMEQAEYDDPDEAERLRVRARWMYLRARNFGFALVRSNDEEFDSVRARGPDALKAWLAETFDDPEDAPMLFWTGYAWGSAINVSLDDPEFIADLELARAFVARSVELDPSFYSSSGLAFLGFAQAAFPAALGGDPEAGRVFFERALELTQRKALLVQVNYARSYAVATQNRELYTTLLREVLDAGDLGDETRLANKIAKRRAARYLQNIDMYF